jgi:outer membrane protein assembly factor BamB
MNCCPGLRYGLSIVGIGLLAFLLTGQDWPMLGGTPQRNLANTAEKNLPAEWSVKEGALKNVKWVAALGTTSYAGPVVAGGKVFVGTNNGQPRNPKIKGDKGVVMCFDEKTGQLLWQAVHDKLPNPQENDWPQQGVASTPAVDGNRVYYVNNRCDLICADTEGFRDGKNDGVQDEQYTGETDADIVWRLDMIKELGVFPRFLANCSPLVVGDLVFVVTGNGVADDPAGGTRKPPAPKAASFVAVDKKTGKVVWQDASPGEQIMDGQWSNPAYAEVNGKGQIIFPGGDGWLYAFEPQTGKLIWKFDCNPKNAVYKVGGRGTRSYPMATPVVFDNKVYASLGQNPDDGPGVGHLWCIDITRTGDLSPEIATAGDAAKFEANKNSGVVWHFGGEAPKGQGNTRDFLFGRSLSTCAVQDGLVYVAELEGFVHCLDAKTGQHYWEHDVKSGIWSSPSWVDGKVYIGNEDGDVYVFAAGKEKKLLGTVEVGRPLKTPVVAANGVLYVMTDSNLYAIAPK